MWTQAYHFFFLPKTLQSAVTWLHTLWSRSLKKVDHIHIFLDKLFHSSPQNFTTQLNVKHLLKAAKLLQSGAVRRTREAARCTHVGSLPAPCTVCCTLDREAHRLPVGKPKILSFCKVEILSLTTKTKCRQNNFFFLYLLLDEFHCVEISHLKWGSEHIQKYWLLIRFSFQGYNKSQ